MDESSPTRSPECVGYIVDIDRERSFVVIHDEIDRSLLLEIVERHPRTDVTILGNLNVCGSEIDPNSIVAGGHVSGIAELAQFVGHCFPVTEWDSF